MCTDARIPKLRTRCDSTREVIKLISNPRIPINARAVGSGINRNSSYILYLYFIYYIKYYIILYIIFYIYILGPQNGTGIGTSTKLN